ncbi:uncharacterized protein AMSG_00425 [Thecamonas trahens ATCC 50062]|uniref:Uncharacterized protein n=1 Tax=Thecamonas trahens ATCC 50062 TaxID=461836 RepID=A0A0L0DBH6_THETB|nr:hypothetical protein AMSG_00425 [Thecamonas trahens ATCC 50062]KNC48648.1 hypothetical protein AMSG_00425 [Thecamonas trahens ATCC 50062]|eukprot:XP_013762704.1 hypothetical protein AMSG_00425 [Thecamonas trahens ATCC 50062]
MAAGGAASRKRARSPSRGGGPSKRTHGLGDERHGLGLGAPLGSNAGGGVRNDGVVMQCFHCRAFQWVPAARAADLSPVWHCFMNTSSEGADELCIGPVPHVAPRPLPSSNPMPGLAPGPSEGATTLPALRPLARHTVLAPDPGAATVPVAQPVPVPEPEPEPEKVVAATTAATQAESAEIAMALGSSNVAMAPGRSKDQVARTTQLMATIQERRESAGLRRDRPRLRRPLPTVDFTGFRLQNGYQLAARIDKHAGTHPLYEGMHYWRIEAQRRSLVNAWLWEDEVTEIGIKFCTGEWTVATLATARSKRAQRPSRASISRSGARIPRSPARFRNGHGLDDPSSAVRIGSQLRRRALPVVSPATAPMAGLAFLRAVRLFLKAPSYATRHQPVALAEVVAGLPARPGLLDSLPPAVVDAVFAGAVADLAHLAIWSQGEPVPNIHVFHARGVPYVARVAWTSRS